MTSLNVIALISGGKDSLFSLLHCVEHGHRIVALANLHPPLSQSTYSKEQQQETTCDATDNTDEDIDSFLYQTIGHSLVPLYAEALQLPLYRHQITGTATQDSRIYNPSLSKHSRDSTDDNIARAEKEDEAESLTSLLQTILEKHPDANAVSSGAILSTYQRVRIESVATRLGLIPLSLLWQYPALPPPLLQEDENKYYTGGDAVREDSLTGLLDDMAAAGCEARIIKLSSGGLDESLVLANVTSRATRNRLVRGMRPYFPNSDSIALRGAILGEGGEYETLALSGPRSLWKGGRVVLDDDAVVVRRGEGGVLAVSIPRHACQLLPWQDDHDSPQAQEEPSIVRRPGLFDERFTQLLQQIAEVGDIQLTAAIQPSQKLPGSLSSLSTTGSPSTILVGSDYPKRHKSTPCLQISNITHLTSPQSSTASESVPFTLSSALLPDRAASQALRGSQDDISAQTRALLDNLAVLLQPIPASATSIVATTLLLRHMSHFATVNPIYLSMFPAHMSWPPSRVAIALGECMDIVDPGINVAMSIIVDLDVGTTSSAAEREKKWKGLHVQSRSYWAPANIGPYSQAISVPEDLAGPATASDSQCSGFESNEGGLDLPPVPMIDITSLAGQIPLIPATMEIYNAPFRHQAVLALQHLWRVAQERLVDCFAIGIAYLPRSNNETEFPKAQTCWSIWQSLHQRNSLDPEADPISSEEDNGPDAWDLRFNRPFNLLDPSRDDEPSGQPTQTHLHPLPNHAALGTTHAILPPLIISEVEELPRSAPVEWCGLGLGLDPDPNGSEKGQVEVAFCHQSKKWGGASWTKLSPHRSSSLEQLYTDSRDPASNKKTKSIVFITLYFRMDHDTEFPPLESTITSLFSSSPTSPGSSGDSNVETASTAPIELEIVHGTIYLSTTALAPSSRLKDWTARTTAGADRLCLVPCRRVWVGIAELRKDRSTNRLQGQMQEHEDENGNVKFDVDAAVENVEESCVREVAVAVEMRVDMF